MGWQVFSVVTLFAGDTIINPTGMFVYSGAPGSGNLIASIAPTSGTDQFGNAYQAGVTSYTAGGFPFTQMTSGQIEAMASGTQFAPAIIQTAGVAGELAMTSGEATGADSAANIIIDSVAASGTGASQISLQATNVSLNTFASSTVPSANTYPGHQSAAPAAYNQAYEQASTNRINEILDVLTQTGVWHT